MTAIAPGPTPAGSLARAPAGIPCRDTIPNPASTSRPRGPFTGIRETQPPAAWVRISLNPSPPSESGHSSTSQPFSAATAAAAIPHAWGAEMESLNLSNAARTRMPAPC